jgi:two-component system sensor histidine kinase MtrB
VVVGSQIDIPSAGKYELYLVYDLVSAQQTLDFVQSTLVFGGAILILLIGAVAYYVSTRVVNPIRIAASAAEELAAGALDRRLAEKGEDTIANLARSFNSMASSLQSQIGALNKLSKMQQRFVSDVSHELRTPLTTIKLSVAILDQTRCSATCSRFRDTTPVPLPPSSKPPTSTASLAWRWRTSSRWLHLVLVTLLSTFLLAR